MGRDRSFGMVAIVAAGLLGCAAATAAAQEGSPPPLPAPGRLVDVGGWSLHLHCTGTTRAGRPTVVLEAGIGDFSVEWSLVQPRVSTFARVCSYDRAGDGWSEMGPHPRTLRQIAYELHTLLSNAGERPPYVLVGHSYGAWLVRQYASAYPTDVVGVVLVDGGADNPWRMMPNGSLVRSADLVTGQPIPAVKTSGPLRVGDIPPAALQAMRAGLADASRRANEPPRDRLPQDAQRMRTWALAQLGHVAAAVNPFEHEELAVLRAERERGGYPLGDVPLVVLVRGIPDEDGPDGRQFQEEHERELAAVAAMSRAGELVVAVRSGHHVQIEEPELVVYAIRRVLQAARGNRR
jgi:pimeloyl-ACP methyl ester carboxylesterase